VQFKENTPPIFNMFTKRVPLTSIVLKLPRPTCWV